MDEKNAEASKRFLFSQEECLFRGGGTKSSKRYPRGVQKLPGFYLDQLDNRILYRYVWLCKRGKVYPQLATSIVGMAMFFQGAFEGVLNRLASGQETYLSLLEEIMRTLNKGGGV